MNHKILITYISVSAVAIAPISPIVCTPLMATEQHSSVSTENTPRQIADELNRLASARALTLVEMRDYGVALMEMREWERASAIFEACAALTPDPREKACALYYASQAISLSGRQLNLAGQFLNQAGQLAPESDVIIAARLAVWKRVGDQLEIKCAEDRALSADVAAEGLKVMDPVTGIVVCTGLILGAVLIYHVYETQSDRTGLSPEQIKDIVLAMIKAGSLIVRNGR